MKTTSTEINYFDRCEIVYVLGNHIEAINVGYITQDVWNMFLEQERKQDYATLEDTWVPSMKGPQTISMRKS